MVWTLTGRDILRQVWKEIATLRILNLLSSILFVSVKCTRRKVCHESESWARSAPKVSWKSDAISWRKSSLSWKSETLSEARNPTARAPHHIRQRERERSPSEFGTHHTTQTHSYQVWNPIPPNTKANTTTSKFGPSHTTQTYSYQVSNPLPTNTNTNTKNIRI